MVLEIKIIIAKWKTQEKIKNLKLKNVSKVKQKDNVMDNRTTTKSEDQSWRLNSKERSSKENGCKEVIKKIFLELKYERANQVPTQWMKRNLPNST